MKCYVSVLMKLFAEIENGKILHPCSAVYVDSRHPIEYEIFNNKTLTVANFV